MHGRHPALGHGTTTRHHIANPSRSTRRFVRGRSGAHCSSARSRTRLSAHASPCRPPRSQTREHHAQCTASSQRGNAAVSSARSRVEDLRFWRELPCERRTRGWCSRIGRDPLLQGHVPIRALRGPGCCAPSRQGQQNVERISRSREDPMPKLWPRLLGRLRARGRMESDAWWSEPAGKPNRRCSRGRGSGARDGARSGSGGNARRDGGLHGARDARGRPGPAQGNSHLARDDRWPLRARARHLLTGQDPLLPSHRRAPMLGLPF